MERSSDCETLSTQRSHVDLHSLILSPGVLVTWRLWKELFCFSFFCCCCFYLTILISNICFLLNMYFVAMLIISSDKQGTEQKANSRKSDIFKTNILSIFPFSFFVCLFFSFHKLFGGCCLKYSNILSNIVTCFVSGEFKIFARLGTNKLIWIRYNKEGLIFLLYFLSTTELSTKLSTFVNMRQYDWKRVVILFTNSIATCLKPLSLFLAYLLSFISRFKDNESSSTHDHCFSSYYWFWSWEWIQP